MEAEVDLGSNPSYPPTLGPSPPQFTSHPSVSPRLPHLADLSPELQYEINVGPAGNERSPQEIEEEGGQKKNSARSRRTDFWHVDGQCGRLFSTLSGLTHLPVAALQLRPKRQEKSSAFLLLPFFFCFFSWHGPPPAMPRKWTSREGLFQRGLVCVVPRSKTT